MVHPLTRFTIFTITLFAIAGCNSDNSSLTQNIPCEQNDDCGSDQTCRINLCIDNGSLPEDGTCTNEIQCGDGLICYGSVCILGCRDIYHQDDCPAQHWCDPVAHRFVEDSTGYRTYIGLCEPSECSPSDPTECDDPSQCLQISSDVGACVPKCNYTFLDASYTDDCVDQDDIPHSCQVVGEVPTSTCLPSGTTRSLSVGEVQCDTINRPCQLGQVCVNVVCRQLCEQNQGPSCGTGESCVPLEGQGELRYCKAD